MSFRDTVNELYHERKEMLIMNNFLANLLHRSRKDEVLTEDTKLAAQFWAERFFIKEKKESFRQALEVIISRIDRKGKAWIAYNEDDPGTILLRALKKCKAGYEPGMYSGSRFFPDKTGIRKDEEGCLWCRDRGGAWVEIAKQDREAYSKI